MKHLGRLRTIINLGQRMGWINQNPFDFYKFNFKKVERGFLTEEELKSIEEKEFGISRLDTVKDLFVFSCYTGLSYVDAINLTPDEVSLGIDGCFWIFTSRKKLQQK